MFYSLFKGKAGGKVLKIKGVLAGWQAPTAELFGTKEEYSRNRRNILFSNYAGGIAGNLIGANFFTGLLLLMKADDAFIGLVTMVVMFGNMLQVFSPLLLERFSERKKILIIGRIAIHFFNIIIISVIPLTGYANSLKLAMILVVTLLINIINAMLAPGYQIWHIRSIPTNLRSRYFSFFQITNGVIIYSIILIASRVVDAFKQTGNELTGLLVLRGIALFLAVVDVIFLYRVREYPVTNRRVRVRDVLLSPFKEKKYLITVAMACLWSFSANIPGSYYSVYLLKDLNISYSFINTVNMLSVPVMMLVMPFWRKRVDTTSWFRALYLSIGLYIVHYIGLALVTGKTLYFYPIFLVYAFLISPGINLVFSNLPFVNMPEENQTNLLGFYAAMNNFAGFLGVSLGRQFITMTESVRLTVGGTVLGNKQLILLLTASLMIVGVLLIYKLSRLPSVKDQEG
jgi:hypothetical protein